MRHNTEVDFIQQALLEEVALVGVVTHSHLVRTSLISANRLTFYIRELLDSKLIRRENRTHYYANAKGAPSPIYALTESGADFLNKFRGSNTDEIKACGLTGLQINHALAVRDTGLVAGPLVDSLTRTKAIDFGSSGKLIP